MPSSRALARALRASAKLRLRVCPRQVLGARIALLAAREPKRISATCERKHHRWRRSGYVALSEADLAEGYLWLGERSPDCKRALAGANAWLAH